MRYIFPFIMIVTIFITLFCLSMEETNAYELDSFYGIPVTNDKGACYGYKACYFWGGYKDEARRNTINMDTYHHERDYMDKISHEFNHPFYEYKLSDKEKEIWNNLSSDKYDPWLQNNGINTDVEFISDYAKNMSNEGKYDEDFAEHGLGAMRYNGAEGKPKTKQHFKMKLINHWHKKYKVSQDYKENYFDF